METSLIFLKYSVCIKKFIMTSVKYGGKQITKAAQNRYWPVIFWVFLVILFFVDRPIDFSIKFNTIKTGWSTVYIEGSQVIMSKHNCISFSEDCFCLSKHPKQMFKLMNMNIVTTLHSNCLLILNYTYNVL